MARKPWKENQLHDEKLCFMHKNMGDMGKNALRMMACPVKLFPGEIVYREKD